VKVGITGHQSLADPQGWDWVRVEMDALLTKLPEPIIGLTCLAVGADSLFAQLVLQHHGLIEAVLPFPGYEGKLQAHDSAEYKRLLDGAARVTTLPRQSTDEESYFVAGKNVVDLADLVIAVWDGKPAKGLGGTGDIVEYARQRKKAMVHLDPVRHWLTVHNYQPGWEFLKSTSPHPFSCE
jgi:hypothetical protein